MSDEHIKKLQEHDSHKKGCVTKHQTEFKQGDPCSYRSNGYTHLATRVDLYHHNFTVDPHFSRLPPDMIAETKLGHAKYDDLDNLINLRTPDNPAKNPTAWFFGVGSNYKIAYEPYNHNYHHILPETSLVSGELKPNELELLQEAGYNVNGKENMIILPCTLLYAVAMMLPDHPGGHRKYNKACENIIKQLKSKAQEGAPTHEMKPENVEDLKKKLLTWQSDQFKVLVAWGKEIAAKGVAERQKNNVNRAPMAAPRS